MTRHLPLLAAALLVLARPTPAQEVAPVATHVVVTALRTLRGCPLKRVITTPQAWAHVTDGLEGAPPAPDFASHVAVLVVADASGGASSRLGPLRLREGGALSLTLLRDEPAQVDTESGAALQCFFIIVPPFAGGLHLDHRLQLGEGGFVQQPHPPSEADRDPQRLPTLGPDVRLTYAMADGSAAPDAVTLRTEVIYRRQDLRGRVLEEPLPAAGLAMAFPRFRDEVRYVLAAYDADRRLRSVRPLVLSALPREGPDGNPRPIAFRFELEKVER